MNWSFNYFSMLRCIMLNFNVDAVDNCFYVSFVDEFNVDDVSSEKFNCEELEVDTVVSKMNDIYGVSFDCLVPMTKWMNGYRFAISLRDAISVVQDVSYYNSNITLFKLVDEDDMSEEDMENDNFQEQELLNQLKPTGLYISTKLLSVHDVTLGQMMYSRNYVCGLLKVCGVWGWVDGGHFMVVESDNVEELLEQFNQK